MDWGQIEVKWAEMARRVRSDLPDSVPDEPASGPTGPTPGTAPDPTEPAPARAKAVAG
jgi:hypothetical protein